MFGPREYRFVLHHERNRHQQGESLLQSRRQQDSRSAAITADHRHHHIRIEDHPNHEGTIISQAISPTSALPLVTLPRADRERTRACDANPNLVPAARRDIARRVPQDVAAAKVLENLRQRLRRSLMPLQRAAGALNGRIKCPVARLPHTRNLSRPWSGTCSRDTGRTPLSISSKSWTRRSVTGYRPRLIETFTETTSMRVHHALGH